MNKTHPKRLTSKQKTLQAVELRLAGYTHEEIGKVMGISRVSVYNRIKKHLERIELRTDETAHELKAIELQRLDKAQTNIWNNVLAGNLSAIDRLIKIMDKRHALLGLETPKKHANATGDDLFSSFVDAVDKLHKKDK